MRAGAGPLLEALRLFDVYVGPGVPEGNRSLAYRLSLRAPDHTLTADGWTRDDAAAVSGNVGISLVWAWTRGNEKFTLSVYSGTGRDALYKQTPELRGRAIALDTSLS